MIKANDPCPCGSGKLHKDCCMNKENVHEFASYRREQFYQAKQKLVEKIGFFLQSKTFHQDFMELKSEFVKRTSGLIQDDLEESFFVFWLFFYHRFEGKLRGLEWFNQVKGHELDKDEKQMLETWINLRPRFLQLINIEGEVAIFQDMETKEHLPFAIHKENVAHPVPWLSTFAMAEEFDGLYYFNGFWMGVGPASLQQAEAAAAVIMEQTGGDRDAVLSEYFPEITAALLNQNWQHEDSQHKLYQYITSYVIKDEQSVLAFLNKQQDFEMEESGNNKKIMWTGNWRTYHDSEIPRPVQSAEVYGTISIVNNRMLIFNTSKKDKAEEMKDRLSALGEKLKHNSDTREALGKQTRHFISIETDVPKCFQVHAEYDVYLEAEKSIPMYSGQSFRNLIENDQIRQAEVWLRNEEYIQYKRVQGRVGDVEVTSNFNGIRMDFGLPQSPFVTGGNDRKTWFE